MTSTSLGRALLQIPLSLLLACLSLFLHPISGPSKACCHSRDYRLSPQSLILSVKCVRMLIHNAVLPLQYALLNQLYFPFWIKLFLLVESMVIKLRTAVTEEQQQIQYSAKKLTFIYDVYPKSQLHSGNQTHCKMWFSSSISVRFEQKEELRFYAFGGQGLVFVLWNASDAKSGSDAVYKQLWKFSAVFHSLSCGAKGKWAVCAWGFLAEGQ